MDYFDTHNILCPQHHGFKSKHSCETLFIGFTQDIADSLDLGQQTDVIVMDFSKAFDKVDHHKLVHKLMGVNRYITTWIKLMKGKDFLHNRSQQISRKQGILQAPCAFWCPTGLGCKPMSFLSLH